MHVTATRVGVSNSCCPEPHRNSDTFKLLRQTWLQSDPSRSKLKHSKSPPRSRPIHHRPAQRTRNNQVKRTLPNSSPNMQLQIPSQSLPNRPLSEIRQMQRTEPPRHRPRLSPSPNRPPLTSESMTVGSKLTTRKEEKRYMGKPLKTWPSIRVSRGMLTAVLPSSIVTSL